MTSHEVQPWGNAPTPLLPKSLVDLLNNTEIPSHIRSVLGVESTIADLGGGVWSRINYVDAQTLKDIIALTLPVFSSVRRMPIRSGETLVAPLLDLPFSVRTRNCISQNLDRFNARQLSFADILDVPSFGARSAIEFACVIEAAMVDGSDVDTQVTSSQTSVTKEVTTPREITSAFQILAAYAVGENNLMTLAGVLPDARDDWPPEIKSLWESMNQVGAQELAGDLVNRYSVPKLMARVLAPLDDRLREIVEKRVLVTERGVTLEVLGEGMDITRERVRQLEKKALKHLERIRNSEFRPIVRRANKVKARLGVGVPADDQIIQETLDQATQDIAQESNVSTEFAASLLLWLAGPYKKRQGWLLATKHLKKLTLAAILDRRNERGVVGDAEAEEVLKRFGFRQETHRAWIEMLGNFRSVEGGYIYFKGSILEKVRSLLLYRNEPIGIEEIMASLGGGSIRSVRQRLTDDSGFWRINKQCDFVIAGTPGYDEYTGITDEIVQEIEACGGEASVDHLVEKLTRVYGVQENSVNAYISTPMFTKDKNGIVRLRDIEIEIDIETDITKTAGCYQKPDGNWIWRVLIDKDVARGSGRLVPNAFAKEIGCSLGDKIEVNTTEGPLTFSWRLASTTGASIGSLRPALTACGAELGDYLFVCAANNAISFERLSKNTLDSVDSSLQRLCLIVGAGPSESDEDALSKIAVAVGITELSGRDVITECRRQLNARGESDFAEMIPSPTLTVDDYFANMEKLFDS